MSAIGLSADEVKPVLLQLLKASEKNWDYIEADNYQVLVQTFWELQEAKLAEDEKKGNKDDFLLGKRPRMEAIELYEDQASCDVEVFSESLGFAQDPYTPMNDIASGTRESSQVQGGSSATPTVMVQTVTDENDNDGLQRIYQHFMGDITKGVERISISLVDEYGGEELPNFVYIRKSIVYQSACLQISLARISDADCCSSCLDDCVAQQLPCACACETGGSFAYTVEGRLNDKFLEDCLSMKANPQQHHLFFCQDCPLERAKNEHFPAKCNGHLIRKFIKECWVKCGCAEGCGNRVVQRGINCNLQVFMTHAGKGWGVRALQDLPRGTFVCEYAGEILTNTELYERNMTAGGKGRHTYPVTLDADWGSEKTLKDEEALCLDATYYGNVARFINHRCYDANLTDIPVQVETPDRHYYHLALFTVRDVKAQEELTWDYGIDFADDDHPVKAFKCRCGSRFCRDNKKLKRKLVVVLDD
ncbi:unnamed protein product [Linum trigynum]|uniref:SET domain-containing protein n=1 Tax=Linum trigynum TaxID=586398 RepID=A0AAV2EAL4_9ROSI